VSCTQKNVANSMCYSVEKARSCKRLPLQALVEGVDRTEETEL